MVRTTKKTTETEIQMTYPVVELSVSSSVESVKPKVSRSKKAKEVVTDVSLTSVPVPAVAEPKTQELVTQETQPLETLESEIQVEQSVEFHAKLQQLSVLVSSIKSDYKQLEKKYQRDLKLAQKTSNKKKRKTGNRAPSGFVKPTRISDELASFLDKPVGTEMARTSVTRDINAYIRLNNLQDKENGRKIIPDKKLATLLKITSSDELTYFNLQRYMSSHFAKSVKAEPVAVDVITTSV